MATNIKFKFENSNKIFEMRIADNDNYTFNDYQKKYLTSLAEFENLETRLMCNLYNPETNLYILSYNDLKSSKII